MKSSTRLAARLIRASICTTSPALMSGCVAAKHYDEARSVAESEMAAHQHAQARLGAALERVRSLEQSLDEKEQALAQKDHELDAGQSVVAQSKLEATVAMSEKRAASELVDQLRGELARTGDHLSVFSHEKRDLEQALVLAEQRLTTAERAERSFGELLEVTRDLALSLGEPLGAGLLALGTHASGVSLYLPNERVFAGETDQLLAQAEPYLASFARVSGRHPTLRVLVLSKDPGASSAARADRIKLGLTELGVADERITLDVTPAEPSPADATAPSGIAPDATAPLAADAPVNGAAPEAPEPTEEAPAAAPEGPGDSLAPLPESSAPEPHAQSALGGYELVLTP